jgi:plasmid stabilization system protein ParE
MLRVLHARIKEIAKQPQIYRLRPELGAEARLATVGHYVILFRIRQNVVRIERVMHGGRDLLPILEEAEK